jgi:hypothetical protein
VSVLVVQRSSIGLYQLPAHLQLSSLQLDRLTLRVNPAVSLRGRRASIALRGVHCSSSVSATHQLRLNECKLIDGYEGLAALPAGLEHFSIKGVFPTRQVSVRPTLLNPEGYAGFPTKNVAAAAATYIP